VSALSVCTACGLHFPPLGPDEATPQEIASGKCPGCIEYDSAGAVARPTRFKPPREGYFEKPRKWKPGDDEPGEFASA